MSNQIPYYIGLDMGTNSVGWAVTDENYKILRGKGKDMWGVRLFDEAQTAADRRINRVARRRRQREVARIGLIKEYFADALHDVDPGFMVRLDESKYWLEDRSDVVTTTNRNLHFLTIKLLPTRNIIMNIRLSSICVKNCLNPLKHMMCDWCI